jgi:hypothetical protein
MSGTGHLVARIAGLWTIAVSIGILVFVVETGISSGALILALPVIAACLGLVAPRSLGALVVADFLLGATAVLLLIGWVGLLYVPPLVMFLIATASAARSNPAPTAN